MAIGRPLNLTPNIATKNISVIATAGQTLFTVNNGYRINEIGVYRNGTRLVDGRDFTASDGSTVTLLSAATVGDVLEFAVFDSFNVVNTIKPSGESTQSISGDLTVTGTITGGTVTGAAIGIQSAGTVVGAAKTLNFIGTGNTFAMNGSTVDISISGGGGGGGLGTAIAYDDDTASPFSYIDKYVTVDQDIVLDTSNAGVNTSIIVSVIPQVTIASGIAVTVGAGKTVVIDVLEIADL
ncbi:MAG: hypothetical protein CL606_08415 [Anaerolineaceae bacterium]|nr:hypothetical protein [Anaerolineaceae bacterium]|tara:strand:+ start:3465 stop:4178 length:714 start_codon:yes stop_codon:yes gene_type:complete